jgi:hypothetical protein
MQAQQQQQQVVVVVVVIEVQEALLGGKLCNQGVLLQVSPMATPLVGATVLMDLHRKTADRTMGTAGQQGSGTWGRRLWQYR